MIKKFASSEICTTFALAIAEIAQLVEHNLAKVRVASSSLVFRSKSKKRIVTSYPFFDFMAIVAVELATHKTRPRAMPARSAGSSLVFRSENQVSEFSETFFVFMPLLTVELATHKPGRAQRERNMLCGVACKINCYLWGKIKPLPCR